MCPAIPLPAGGVGAEMLKIPEIPEHLTLCSLKDIEMALFCNFLVTKSPQIIFWTSWIWVGEGSQGHVNVGFLEGSDGDSGN